MSVGRPCDRPLHATVDRAVNRANPVHVVHTGRPGGRLGLSPVDRAVDREISWPATMHRSLPLSSGFCTIFLYLIYLLSPYTSLVGFWKLQFANFVHKEENILITYPRGRILAFFVHGSPLCTDSCPLVEDFFLNFQIVNLSDVGSKAKI